MSGLGGWPRRLVLAGGLDFSLLLDMGVAMPLVGGLLSLVGVLGCSGRHL